MLNLGDPARAQDRRHAGTPLRQRDRFHEVESMPRVLPAALGGTVDTTVMRRRVRARLAGRGRPRGDPDLIDSVRIPMATWSGGRPRSPAVNAPARRAPARATDQRKAIADPRRCSSL